MYVHHTTIMQRACYTTLDPTILPTSPPALRQRLGSQVDHVEGVAAAAAPSQTSLGHVQVEDRLVDDDVRDALCSRR